MLPTMPLLGAALRRVKWHVQWWWWKKNNLRHIYILHFLNMIYGSELVTLLYIVVSCCGKMIVTHQLHICYNQTICTIYIYIDLDWKCVLCSLKKEYVDILIISTITTKGHQNLGTQKMWPTDLSTNPAGEKAEAKTNQLGQIFNARIPIQRLFSQWHFFAFYWSTTRTIRNYQPMFCDLGDLKFHRIFGQEFDPNRSGVHFACIAKFVDVIR